MENIFFDANVIADWLLVNSKITETEESKRNDELKNLWKNYTAPKASFEIIETIMTTSIKNYKFFTSDLALSEVSHVFHKEVASEKLIKKGIAYRYLPKFLRRSDLSEDEIKEIEKKIGEFRKKFVDGPKPKIKRCAKLKDPLLPTFIILYFNIDTYDAFLISQAIEAKCKYFITKDDDLKVVETPKISIVSPEKFKDEIAKIKFDYGGVFSKINFNPKHFKTD